MSVDRERLTNTVSHGTNCLHTALLHLAHGYELLQNFNYDVQVKLLARRAILMARLAGWKSPTIPVE